MQTVPQIRLFGSTQAWRPSSQFYQKKYTQSSSTGFQPSNHQAHKVQATIQTSNSVSQLNSSKPTHNDYYKNAIKICQQNRILTKFEGHRLQYLKGPYITQNHRQHNPRRPCTLCEAQAITKKFNLAKQQKCMTPKFKPSNQSHQPFFNTFDCFQSQTSQNQSHLKQQYQIDTQKANSNIVTFQEISNQEKSQRKDQAKMSIAEIRKIDTEPSKEEQLEIKGLKCDTGFKENKTRTFQKENRPTTQSNNFAQISQLILQLGREDDDPTGSTSFMLKQLQEMTQQHLKKRRNCINQLDQILRRFQSSPRPFEPQSHIQLQPSLSLELVSNSQCLDNLSAQNSKRRNKIF